MLSFNTNCYNVGFAKRYGVITSILVNYIDNEFSYNMATGNIKSDGRFYLDRVDISYRTGASIGEIHSAEEVLVKLGVLDVIPCPKNGDEKVYYRYFREKLISGISRAEATNPIEDVLSSVGSKEVKTHYVPKKVKELQSLKSSIKEEDSLLRQYMCDWLDSIYAKGLSTTKAALDISIQELSKFSKEQKESILRSAICMGCKNISYAISNFEKSNSNSGNNWKSYADMQPDDSTIITSEVF